MVNFKKIASMIVVFSLVLCSCGNKDTLRNKDASSSETTSTTTPKATSAYTPCCFNEDLTPWGLKEGQCDDPLTTKCYNSNIVSGDSSNSKETSLCCFGNLNVGQCVQADTKNTSLCYFDISKYRTATIEKIFHEYGYDATIRELKQKLSDGKMSIEEAIEEVNERVEKIPKPVEIIGEADFEKEVKSSDKPVLVDFWLTDCPHCEKLSPLINELTSEYEKEGKIKICKVVADEANRALLEKYKVNSFPTLLLFKNGKFKEMEKEMGEKIARTKDNIKKFINTVL